MKVITGKIELKTRADGGIHDVTDFVAKELEKSSLKEGTVTVFCTGSTYSVSTMEFEPGLCKDVPASLDRIAPGNIPYAHHEMWHDDNGRSHVKATLMGPSLTIPFVNGELTRGTWQQIVVLEFDTRPRTRQLILQFLGV